MATNIFTTTLAAPVEPKRSWFGRLVERLAAGPREQSIEELSDEQLRDIGIEPPLLTRIQELRQWDAPHRSGRTAWTELMLRPPYR